MNITAYHELSEDRAGRRMSISLALSISMNAVALLAAAHLAQPSVSEAPKKQTVVYVSEPELVAPTVMPTPQPVLQATPKPTPIEDRKHPVVAAKKTPATHTTRPKVASRQAVKPASVEPVALAKSPEQPNPRLITVQNIALRAERAPSQGFAMGTPTINITPLQTATSRRNPTFATPGIGLTPDPEPTTTIAANTERARAYAPAGGASRTQLSITRSGSTAAVTSTAAVPSALISGDRPTAISAPTATITISSSGAGRRTVSSTSPSAIIDTTEGSGPIGENGTERRVAVDAVRGSGTVEHVATTTRPRDPRTVSEPNKPTIRKPGDGIKTDPIETGPQPIPTSGGDRGPQRPPAPTPPLPPAPGPRHPEGRNADSEETYAPDAELSSELKQRASKTQLRISVTVEIDGSHTERIVEGSGDPEIDALVLKTMRRWKWRAAIKDGVKVTQTKTFRYTIRVDD